MRKLAETPAQKWTGLWHLYRAGWFRQWAMPVAVLILVVVLIFAAKSGLQELVSQVERSRWWNGLAPSIRYLGLRLACEAFGCFFLKRRLRANRWPADFVGFRGLLAEIALVAGGLLFLLRAAGKV